MGTSKHTPGPWEVVHDTCAECAAQGVAEYVIIGPPGGYHGQFSNKADARLIAAAPDLLEALQAALEWIDAIPADTQLPAMPGFDRDAVNDVIAKAAT